MTAGGGETGKVAAKRRAGEPVETKTGGIDAFPRNGVAGPGCQAATVADGRREKETEAPRWRKCASWMQGGPKNGITKARHRRVAGWRPDEGRKGAINANLLANRFILVGRIAVFHHAERFCFRQVGH